MSFETSVAVVTPTRRDELLDVLTAWAEGQPGSAAFGITTEPFYARGARVVAGHVNHLDVESLLAAVRDAMAVPDWYFFDEAVVVLCDDEGVLRVHRLDSLGRWSRDCTCGGDHAPHCAAYGPPA